MFLIKNFRKLTFLVCMLVICTSCSNAESNNQNYKILVVGDSLSAAYGIDPNKGWVELMRNSLISQGLKVEIDNISTSGDTTDEGLQKLPRALSKNPDIVIIALGSNDGLRGISQEHMKNNLQEMITLSKEANSKVVFVGFKLPFNYGGPFRARFEKVFHDLAAENNLPFVEFLLDGLKLGPQYFLADGIHPNENAQPIIQKNVESVLITQIK